MESTKSYGGKVAVLVAAVVVMMVANEIHAQIYACWGGCYNECILLASSSNGTSTNNGTTSTDQEPQDRFPCYYQCLNGCVPRSTGDYGYYCQIGCNIERCPPNTTYDGAALEKCYGTCADLCKNT